MRNLVVVAALLAPSVAVAETLAGGVFGLQPASEIEHGGLNMWLARGMGAGYVGGEISIGTYVTPNDAGISYHALAGVRTNVGPTLVLADAGAGITQQFDCHLGILGGESDCNTKRVLPSGAARVQLVGEIGKIGLGTFGLALSSEARIGYADGEATTGIGIGLGLYFAR